MTRWGGFEIGTSRKKYGNAAAQVDGKLFDSRKEANRYMELLIMQRAGKISNLRTQVKYILIPEQRELPPEGSKKLGKVIERECAYLADFAYEDLEDGGKTVVEDTKGFRTKEYIIKRKLMLERFGIRIREL